MKNEPKRDQKRDELLKKLENDGLCSMEIEGAGSRRKMIVHDLTPIVLLELLNKDNEPVITFLEHTPNQEGECGLIKSSSTMIKKESYKEKFEELKKLERASLESHRKNMQDYLLKGKKKDS